VEYDFLVVFDPPRLDLSFHGEDWTHHVVVDNLHHEFRKVIYHRWIIFTMSLEK
jgi:hypothetical protein